MRSIGMMLGGMVQAALKPGRRIETNDLGARLRDVNI